MGTVAVAAVILSACSSSQNSASGSATTAPPAPTTQATTSAQATASAPQDACASATTATLNAALKANKAVTSAVIIDSKGIQSVKCQAPWAVGHITNGSIVFQYQNGAWVATTGGGSGVCEDLPPATAEKICD